MARSLQVLSLLSRLGALSVAPSVSANSCRFASRGASKPWIGQSHVRKEPASNISRSSDEASDGDFDIEDVEDKLQALVDEESKRQKTVKYHVLRRKMTPSGAPQRKLTWDALEQIRYLKQHQPEEWTVERLAEGFSVTPDVILRVLRSKFVPSPERKAKQNAKVMARLGQQVLPSGAGTRLDTLQLPGNRTPDILSSGSTEALVPVANHMQMIRGEGSGSRVKIPVSLAVLPAAGICKDATVTGSTEDNSSTDTCPSEEDEEDEERWNGRVFTEEELEFMEKEKASPVVQVGNEFFDAEGNFLYRI